jgi:hypothetical protein
MVTCGDVVIAVCRQHHQAEMPDQRRTPRPFDVALAVSETPRN